MSLHSNELALTHERWLEAQRHELEWWHKVEPQHPQLLHNLAYFYQQKLHISAAGCVGQTVTDIGGGPRPLAIIRGLPVEHLVIVDPLTIGVIDTNHVVKHWTTSRSMAETYEGPPTDEVWGYNVLQHVQNPLAVLQTAKAHALKRVRWFDWVDTPVAPHHPHSIDKDWLLEQLVPLSTDPIWRTEYAEVGTHPEHNQRFVAVVIARG